MKTPALVVAAVLVEPAWAGPILVQPHTLRRQMQMEDIRSPLLTGAACRELSDIVQAVRIFDARWPHIDEPAFCNMVRPAEVAQVVDGIRASIALGWSTCLAMQEPPTPGQHQRETRPGRDRFGTATRLWAYAVKVLHIDPATALDLPLCQINVLAATSEALTGKVPAADDYFELSRSITPAVPLDPLAKATDEPNHTSKEKEGEEISHKSKVP